MDIESLSIKECYINAQVWIIKKNKNLLVSHLIIEYNIKIFSEIPKWISRSFEY